MDKNNIGAWGEARAARYLRFHGYSIIEQNFTCRQGEIDIIASKRDIIAFVEVKLRKNARFGEAREFVTHSKQQRIITAAELWLSKNETELQPRFDVIEVYAPDGRDSRSLKINHLKNAF